MLIDTFVPRWQFREEHRIAVAAPPLRVWEIMAARDILGDDPVVRAMMAVRRAPSALWQTIRPTAKPSITTFGTHSFTRLAQDETETVTGLVGQFWRPSGGLRVIPDANAFLAFAHAHTPKLAMNFVCVPQGGGSLLTTETRVFCPSALSRALFTPYWLAIRLGSGFIRKRYLRAVKCAAEKDTA
jgi:hypothetical protein